MEEINHFCQTLREGILDYYDRTYNYIKDLFGYKNVDLKFETAKESEENIRNVLETMTKIVKVALNTIGVQKEKILAKESEFKELESKRGNNYPTYNSYYNELKHIVDKFLFEILIEYIIDEDVQKISSLQLFDLLPKEFKIELDKYKLENITSTDIKLLIHKNLPEIENYIDYSDFSIKKELVKPLEPVLESEEEEILRKLGEARKANIEVLRSHETLSKEEIGDLDLLEPMMPAPHSHSEKLPAVKPLPGTEVNNFLDYFGNFSSFDSSIVKKFRINYDNLLNSFGSNLKEYFNLETLFYFLTILKMINIPLPFSTKDVIGIAKNYINEKVFSSSKKDEPNPVDIFYGLAIFTELQILKNSDVVDVFKINDYLGSELQEIIPEKIHLYYYILLSLRLLKKIGLETPDISNEINPILRVNLSNLEDYNPVVDIFDQLAIIKIFENILIPSHFKGVYLKELKKYQSENGSINNIVSDTSKTLLILEMLDLKDKEKDFCDQMVNYITSEPLFFDSSDLDSDFNWQKDKLGYLVELRMLFWALIACSRYF